MIGLNVDDETNRDSGGDAWSGGPPPTIRVLEVALQTAGHAFDDMHRMSFDHRVRVVNELAGLVPDAASAAARAGESGWARSTIRLAALTPPPWAEICNRWSEILVSAQDAIDAVEIALATSAYERSVVRWAIF